MQLLAPTQEMSRWNHWFLHDWLTKTFASHIHILSILNGIFDTWKITSSKHNLWWLSPTSLCGLSTRWGNWPLIYTPQYSSRSSRWDWCWNNWSAYCGLLLTRAFQITQVVVKKFCLLREKYTQLIKDTTAQQFSISTVTNKCSISN